MYIHTGFYQDDLNVFLRGGDIVEDRELIENDGNEEFFDGWHNNQSRIPFYMMVYIFEGSGIVKIGNHELEIKKNTVAFAKPDSGFDIKIIPDNNKFKYILVSFLPHFLPSPVSNDDFLRAFHELPDENKYINDDTTLRELFENLYYFVFNGYEQFYVHSAVRSLVAGICLNYDRQHMYYHGTDSVYVKIMNYIKNNFTKIKKIKDIEDKFFISANTLEKIVKLIANMSVWEYITELRLDYAHSLIESGRFSVGKCGEMAGFESYTAFYRNYKRRYGISPSLKQKEKKADWPLK
ncbi:MAG: helix-turn-helix transcriptional regulator [Acutalibacteraceae bacterium]